MKKKMTGCYSRCSHCLACKSGPTGLPSSRKDTSTGGEQSNKHPTVVVVVCCCYCAATKDVNQLLRFRETASVLISVCICLNDCLVTNREAFSGFSVDAVAKYTEKQMASLSADYGLDLGTVRGTVNNACRILEVP